MTFVSCRELRSSHGLHSFSAHNTAFTAHDIVLRRFAADDAAVELGARDLTMNSNLKLFA